MWWSFIFFKVFGNSGEAAGCLRVGGYQNKIKYNVMLILIMLIMFLICFQIGTNILKTYQFTSAKSSSSTKLHCWINMFTEAAVSVSSCEVFCWEEYWYMWNVKSICFINGILCNPLNRLFINRICYHTLLLFIWSSSNNFLFNSVVSFKVNVSRSIIWTNFSESIVNISKSNNNV